MKSSAKPPVAPRRPQPYVAHGITVQDDYAWLKDANWQEVLRDPALLSPDIRAHLEAENAYTESVVPSSNSTNSPAITSSRP